MYKQIFSPKHLALYVLAACMASCGGDDNDGFQFGESTGGGTGVAPSTEITTRMETPQALSNGTTLVLSHTTRETGGREVLTYSLEFDKAKCHSRWVAFRFDGDTRAKNVSRSDEPFSDDPPLPSNLHSRSNHFELTYNRGHHCHSADRLYSRSANADTF